MTDRKKFIMLILFSIFFPLVIGSVCVLVNGNKISKAKPSGKTILVDNKNYSFEMDMENFISYVLMAQMDENEPEELLKAKSVIIRTYILYKMKDKAQIAASDLGMEYRNYGELKNSRFQDFCRENIKSPKGMAAYFTGIGSYKIYNEKNKNKIIENSKILNIPITMFETDIFERVEKMNDHECYLCARMRRGYLYSKAKELGCNKIALGHHFDDVIETTLIGMFYASQLKAMIPKLHSTNFEGMELIRPMYCIHEEDIISWMNYNGLEFIQCACRFTENYTLNNNEGGMSKRQEIKMLIRQLKKDNPLIDKSIFNSIHAVSLDTMPGYKTHGKTYSFLDNYYNNERSEEQL